jgi:outer membrane protein TolC
MTLKYILASGLLCLLASTALHAQKKVYSLVDLWQKALAHYPSVTAKKNLVEQKEFQRELIKKERLPAINLQAQQSYGAFQGIGGSFFPLPGIYNMTAGKPIDGQPAAASSLYASTMLQWDLIQFGRLRKKLDEANADVALSNAALQSEEIRLREISTRYYFNYLQANALLSIARDDSARLEHLYQLSKAQTAAGLRPGADTMLLKSTFLQAGGAINEQQGLFQTAQLQLAALIGEPPFDLAVDTAFYRNPLHHTIASLPDSLPGHPYLDFLKAKVERAKASLQMIQKDIYPSIGLLAGAGTRGSGLSATGTVDKSLLAPWQTNAGSYLVGIGLTWNLSKLYKNKVQQKIVQSEMEAAHADYEEALLQLTTSYQSALARWTQQVQKLKDARAAYHASIEAYELYLSRYEHGLVSMIELLQLQKTLQEAERYYIQTIAGYWHERINQSVSTGDFTSLLREINP